MMIRYFLLVGLAVALAGPVAGPVLAQAQAQTADPKEKDSDKMNDGDRALDTMENIATRPLKDMNIVKKKIPPELEAMMETPYALKGMRYCRHYVAEVKMIDEMVGPDVDSAEAMAEKAKQTPAEFAFGATEALAGGLIPFSGVVRFISGAQKREQYAASALYAGSLRRAFLKGTARAKGCKI